MVEIGRLKYWLFWCRMYIGKVSCLKYWISYNFERKIDFSFRHCVVTIANFKQIQNQNKLYLIRVKTWINLAKNYFWANFTIFKVFFSVENSTWAADFFSVTNYILLKFIHKATKWCLIFYICAILKFWHWGLHFHGTALMPKFTNLVLNAVPEVSSLTDTVH